MSVKVRRFALQYLNELAQVFSQSLGVSAVLTDGLLIECARAVPDSLTAASLATLPSPQRLSTLTSLEELTEPVYLAGNAGLGVPPVMVVPLAAEQGPPLFYLWLTGVDDLSPERLGWIDQVARVTLTALVESGAFTEPQWQDPELGRLFRTGDRPAIDAFVANPEPGRGLVHDDAFVAVAIVLPSTIDGDAERDRVRNQIRSVAASLSELCPPSRRLVVPGDQGCYILFAPPAGTDQASLPQRCRAQASDQIFRATGPGSEPPWLVAVSSLVTVSPGTAVWQARAAIDFALRMGWHHRTLAWNEISHLRPLSLIDDTLLAEQFIPPGMSDLLGDPGSDYLLATLRSFLKHGGAIKEVAEELFLHRASVYHRLRRVEERTGLDLVSGNDRLQAHLALAAYDIVSRRISVPESNADMHHSSHAGPSSGT